MEEGAFLFCENCIRLAFRLLSLKLEHRSALVLYIKQSIGHPNINVWRGFWKVVFADRKVLASRSVARVILLKSTGGSTQTSHPRSYKKGIR